MKLMGLKVYQLIQVSGGMEPEDLEEVRQYAPETFRIQERAVTEHDYT